MKRLSQILRLISLLRTITIWAIATISMILLLSVPYSPETPERTVITCKTLGIILAILCLTLCRRNTGISRRD